MKIDVPPEEAHAVMELLEALYGQRSRLPQDLEYLCTREEDALTLHQERLRKALEHRLKSQRGTP